MRLAMVWLCNNIQVGELEKFKADVKSSTLNFGTKGAKYGMQEAFINFDHANAGRITTAEILSGADSACFAVLPKTLAGTGRDMYGTNTLYVTFDNKDGVGRESTPYTATLRIKDNNGHTEDVTLTGRRWGKTDPTITFNQHHVPYYVNSTISNFAVSTNTDAACPLVYSSTNESISKVEDGKLYIYETKSAVTIRVTQIANADYNAVDTSITFTPCDKPNLTVPFQMADSIRQSTSVTFTLPDGDSHAWDDEKKAIRVGHGDVTPSVWGVRSFVVAFGGAPDTLTFTYQTSSSSTSRSFGGSFLLAPKWKVEQSVDGENWEDLWWTESNSTSSQSVKMALKPTTRYIQFTYNGNGYGYFGDINVTTVDGYKYMRASTGKYLSRGGKWGTQAVVDEFGVPVRVTRYTKDNVHDTTFVQFMDNREFLFEDAYGEVFTDNHKDTERKWIQVIEDGKVSVRRPSGKYVYVAADRTLQLTETAGDAMQWEIDTVQRG